MIQQSYLIDNFCFLHEEEEELVGLAFASITQTERSRRITTRLLSVATMIKGKSFNTKIVNSKQRLLSLYTRYSMLISSRKREQKQQQQRARVQCE